MMTNPTQDLNPAFRGEMLRNTAANHIESPLPLIGGVLKLSVDDQYTKENSMAKRDYVEKQEIRSELTSQKF